MLPSKRACHSKHRPAVRPVFDCLPRADPYPLNHSKLNLSVFLHQPIARPANPALNLDTHRPLSKPQTLHRPADRKTAQSCEATLQQHTETNEPADASRAATNSSASKVKLFYIYQCLGTREKTENKPKQESSDASIGRLRLSSDERPAPSLNCFRLQVHGFLERVGEL